MRRFFAERRRRRRENNTTSNSNNSNTRSPSPPKQRRQELLNQPPETMDNNNNANAADNNHNDSAEQIATELEHVEEQLHRAPSVATFRGSTTAPQQQGGGGGRAAFESVATALASLRRRLSRSVASQRDNQTRGSTAATATAAPSNDNDTSSRRHSSLLQRLETAEMAHSNRIPLGILQQEMERRAQPMESVERRKSTEGGKLKQDTTEDTENTEPPPTAAPQSSSEEGDDSVHSANSANSSIFGLPGSRRRRASTLMASRSRDEALQRASQDRQLHSLGNLESTASILPTVSEDDGDGPSEELASASTKKERFKDQGRNDDSLIPEETSKDLSTEDANDLTLLLTDRSQKQLARSSRSILLASTNSFATDGAQLLDDTVNAVAETTPTSNTVVYSWGTEGAHSLHDTNDTRSAAPEHSKLSQGRVTRHTLLTASIGTHHSAVVTTTGQLLVCGANSHGQVDPLRKDEPTIVKPALFEFPSAALTRVTQVACGGAHTAAVTHTGTVMTWGQNDVGQLGHRRSSGSIPTAMSGPVASCRAAQVACGDTFTTVLTTRMQLYLCGSPDVVTWNAEAVETNQPPLPCMISSLIGVPLVQAVAGARHLIVVSAAGTAFCLGDNDHGCCSRAFPKSIHTPVPVIFSSDNVDKTEAHDESLALAAPFPHWSRRRDDDPIQLDKNIAVQDAACGDAFTLLLTQTGQVHVCGHNHVGQLGSSDHEDILTATLLEVPSLENNENVTFVSVAAGQDQSLLLDSQGQVWSMGQNQPLQVVLPGQHVQSIYAGGQECVAIAPAAPSRSASIQREFSLKKNSSDDEDMIMTETQTTKDEQQHHGELFVVEKLMEQQDKGRLLRRIHDFFSTPTVWNSLFWDPADCADLYDQLLSSSANNDKTKKEDVIAVAKAIEQAMLKGLESLQASEARLLHPESVRFLLLFLQCPLFVHPIVGASEKKPTNEEDQEDETANEKEEDGYEFDARGEVALTLCESFLNLPFEGYKAIQRWAASCYGPKYFACLLVKPLIAMLERGLADGAGARSRVIPGAVTLLRWFHGSSQRNPSLASPSDFYSEAIGDMDPESLYEDLKKWKDNGKRSGTYFLSANTFLLSPTTKRTLLMIENQVEMLRAATSNLTWDREQHQFVFDPFFVLAIDREHMLTQTLQKISAASHVELRKSLKIVFKGEDAVDAGGVTKEFFHLLGHQLFDTSTGMWSTQYGDNVTWFNGDCTWNEDGFYLVGVLTGLSIYNDVMMDVHFPRVLYRKLLGYSLGLEDMVDEETKRGLQQLLDYEGDDVEDIFCLTFEHTWMDMGMSRSIELKEGGADIPVTSSNKEEYVLLYVKWLLVDSVSAQYDAFERGVMQVLESSSLDLLQPEELELLLVGSPDLDIDAWQGKTEYEGFEADSPVIKNFWKFVRNSSREEQLKLLKFATGTSRAPIGGLGAMIFKIQRAGADSDQLPTSHTCFNILIMPDYGENYEKLERLLGRAILECEGFGLQ